jgi:putative molybdopterin biosynthesis protein
MIRLGLAWSTLRAPQIHIDSELFQLLSVIRRTGKLTAAAKQVGVPYRQSWGLIAAWSDRIGRPLVIKEKGRGTRLTPLGERLLSMHERTTAKLAPQLEQAEREIASQLQELLKPSDAALCVHASHDLVLAQLREWLRDRPGPKLDVHFVGSLESVIALCRSRCDIAGFHLPEGKLGRGVLHQYEPWLKPRLHRLIQFVRRTQGLIVAPGNPLRLKDMCDVAKTRARFINRQRGSGTQIALVSILKESGIDRADINGYDNEEFTHIAVAAAVAGGIADVGIGIEAAARKLQVGFVPLFVENYYILTKREAEEQQLLRHFVSLLKTEQFRRIAHALPGYDASRAGAITPLSDILQLQAT